MIVFVFVGFYLLIGYCYHLRLRERFLRFTRIHRHTFTMPLCDFFRERFLFAMIGYF